MNKLFRITPLEKKSVEAYYEVYETLNDGSTRGWAVTETYRFGQGFREFDDEVYDTELDRVRCDPNVGWGAELDDLCGAWFEFDDSYTDDEREEIERLWNEGEGNGIAGAGWLYDGDHQWEIEDEAIYILGPVQIDVVDGDNCHELQVNIKPVETGPASVASKWLEPTFEEEEAFQDIERKQHRSREDEY